MKKRSFIAHETTKKFLSRESQAGPLKVRSTSSHGSLLPSSPTSRRTPDSVARLCMQLAESQAAETPACTPTSPNSANSVIFQDREIRACRRTWRLRALASPRLFRVSGVHIRKYSGIKANDRERDPCEKLRGEFSPGGSADWLPGCLATSRIHGDFRFSANTLSRNGQRARYSNGAANK